MTNTTATKATLTEVLTFIASEATNDDINRIYDAMRGRQRTLAQINTATLTSGDKVEITDPISPKALSGLTGTVKSIRGQRADIELDADSTKRLAFGRPNRLTGAAMIAVQDTKLYTVLGVPASCIATKN